VANWLDANGVSICYVIDGEPGPLVVLLHEMGGSCSSWDGVVPALTAAGYRVLRFDQRGSGRSEKPRGSITARALTDDLAAVIDAVAPGQRYHLVAVAAAAIHALTLADERPGDVASVTLCNPVGGVDPARAAQLEQRAALAERDGMRAALAVTLDRSYPPTMGERAAYERYRGRYLGNDPVCFANLNRALVGADVAPQWRRLGCPAMVVAGTQDQVRPPEGSREFASRRPGTRFELVDSGHMMPAQAPAALAALLVAFLGRLPVPVAGAS
jgi:3-oxoadipate enol-lactonase